jgi:guanylate kinase
MSIISNSSEAPPKTDHSPGSLFIISAPSGAGKTTLCAAVRSRFPDMLYSISHTTRSPRAGETDGKDYYFMTADAFARKIESGGWAEWAKVHGNYYGTSAEFIDQGIRAGKDILLDIDVQGTFKILKRYPDSITIFIMPPSMDVLRQRLEARGTDRQEIIETRMENARQEMAQSVHYRHIIINDNLETAINELISLIERHRRNPHQP